MKRTLYRRLHHTRSAARRSALFDVTAAWNIPDSQVPRWSPGPGWTEVQTARMWVRPADRGAYRALVRTWGRTDGTYNDEPVLLAGDTEYLGAVADKHHKLYQLAAPGSLTTEPLTADHPALVYSRYYGTVADRLDEKTRPWWRWLSLRASCELHPSGTAWACAISVLLAHHGVRYWEDLADATDLIATCARSHPRRSQPPVRVYAGDGPDQVTDPLWTAGWADLEALRGPRPAQQPETHSITT